MVVNFLYLSPKVMVVRFFLSDHDPISISFDIIHAKLRKKVSQKSSYFKANAMILTNLENIQLLKKAWERHEDADGNPHRKLSLACSRLRNKYKEIQSLPKYSNKNVEIL